MQEPQAQGQPEIGPGDQEGADCTRLPPVRGSMAMASRDQGFDGLPKFAALLDPAPGVLQFLIHEELNSWCASNARLLGDVLVGLDVYFHTLRLPP